MPDSLCSYKKMEQISNDLNDDITDNNFKWTSLSSKPKILIGREALCIPNNNNESNQNLDNSNINIAKPTPIKKRPLNKSDI